MIALQGPLVGERAAHKLAAALQENGPGPLGEHARRMTRHPGLWVVEFTHLALVLGIVWNMTQKPSIRRRCRDSVVGYAVGVALALPFTRPRQSENATSPVPAA